MVRITIPVIFGLLVFLAAVAVYNHAAAFAEVTVETVGFLALLSCFLSWAALLEASD